MKKILYFVLLLALFVPSCVFAKEDLSISNVVFVNQYGKASGFENPTYDGLTLNVNGKFASIGDSAEFKITFKNDGDADYIFKLWDDQRKESDTISPGYSTGYNTDHIRYNFHIEDSTAIEDAYIIKAHDTMDIWMNAVYNQRVFKNSLTNGKYSANLDLNFDFISLATGKTTSTSSTSKNVSNNPSTNNNAFLIISLVAISGVVAIVLMKKNKKASKIVAAFAIMLLPACVFAASNIHLTVKGNIEIEPSPEFCVYNISIDYDGLNAEYYPYEEGMTWNSYFLSNPNNNLAIKLSETEVNPIYSDPSVPRYLNAIGAPMHGACKEDCGSYAPGLIQSFDEEIVSYLDGCYTYVTP